MPAPSPEAELEAVVARLRAAGCVFAEDEAELLVAEAPTPALLEHMVAARVSGLPLEQIVGWAEFCGMRIVVEPGVFVPRRRTELMVRLAGWLLHPGDILLDLCCGTGALAVALADAVPGVQTYAADLDPSAVHCARRNLAPEQVFEGDLYAALPDALRGRVEVIVANAPYVPTGAIALMPPEARDHEHRVALDGGGDGLDVQRRVVSDAHAWLAPGGSLLIETGEHQAATTVALMGAAGFETRVDVDDEIGGRVVTGTQPARLV